MPSYRKLPIIITLVPLLTGCTSYTFSDLSTVNLPVPSYFTDRDYISDGSAVFANNLDELPGRIAYKNGSGTYVFMTGTIIENNITPQTKAVQSAYEYSSVIDKSFSESGTFPSITADVSGSTVTAYELRDVAAVQIPTPGEPTRPTFQAAATAAGAPTATPLFWVSGAILSDLREQVSVNLNGSHSISGQAFSIGGNVYDSNTAADWVPLVAVYVVPMNALADADVATSHPSAPSGPPPVPVIGGHAALMMMRTTPATIATAPSPMPSRLSHDKDGLVPALIQIPPS